MLRQQTSVTESNLNERLLTDQMQMLETLRAADNDYRGILTAAASLTSSLKSIKLAKAAIWAAMASLGVALVTLLITDISTNSIIRMIAEWAGLALTPGRERCWGSLSTLRPAAVPERRGLPALV